MFAIYLPPKPRVETRNADAGPSVLDPSDADLLEIYDDQVEDKMVQLDFKIPENDGCMKITLQEMRVRVCESRTPA